MKVRTKLRKQVGTLGGVSYFTDVYLGKKKIGSMLHAKDSKGKPRYLIVSSLDYSNKYFKTKQGAANFIVKNKNRMWT